jgi:hypothetical protein
MDSLKTTIFSSSHQPQPNLPMETVNSLLKQLKSVENATTLGKNRFNQEHGELKTVNGKEVIILTQKEATGLALTSFPAQIEYKTQAFAVDVNDGSVHFLGDASSFVREGDNPWAAKTKLSEMQEEKLKRTNFDAESDTVLVQNVTDINSIGVYEPAAKVATTIAGELQAMTVHHSTDTSIMDKYFKTLKPGK